MSATALQAIIQDHRVPGDHHATAGAVSRVLGLTPEQFDLVGYLLVSESSRLSRQATKNIEKIAFAGPTPEARNAAREAMCRDTFVVGDGRTVRWGEATVDDHRKRIALLESLRSGIARTISFHEEAIAAITQAGVTCLDEVPGFVS